MIKENKSTEEIQREYNKIMKQSSMQILLIPILAVLFIAGAVMDDWMIFKIGVIPILLYMIWFNLVIYRCPKCGHRFNQYQIYKNKCTQCHTNFCKR